MKNEPDTSEDHLLVDLGPEDQWMTDEIRNAVNDLMVALYEADAVVNSIDIIVRRLPGDELSITSDYGIARILDAGLQE